MLSLGEKASITNAGISARACQNCSKAKAKCIPQADAAQSSCARCFRLGKECVPAVRTARKRRSPNTIKNTTQLEQKIESLVTLLSNTRAIPSSLGQTTPPESQGQSEPSPVARLDPTTTFLQNWVPELPIRNEHEARLSPAQHAESSGSSIAQQYSIYSSVPSSTISSPSIPDNLDHLLDLYRERFAPNFPFVIIPRTLSAAQLRTEKPWLFKAVIIAACQENRSLQLEMSKQMLVEVPTAMFLRAEKSLDMLQSLIVYNSWSHAYTPVTPATQSSGMLQLAVAMIYDLGLTKQYREMDSPTEILLDAIANSNASPENMRKETKRTLEEIRTFLACYLLSSVTSYYMKRIEGQPLSLYIIHCCKVLGDAKEHESDLTLIAMIRLYGFVEQVISSVTNRLNATEISAPVWMQIAGLRKDLQIYWETLPPQIKNNPLVLNSFYSTEVFLYRPSLHKHLFTSTNGESIGTHRIDLLYACLLSSKKILDLAVSYPHDYYLYHSILDNAHIGHGLSVLLKLTLVEEAGWDLTEIRRSADMTTYFNRFISNFSAVGTALDASQREKARHSFPTGCARVMGRVKTWYESMVLKVVGENPVQEQQPDIAMGFESIASEDFSDYLNDAYWMELIGNHGWMQEL